LEESTTVMLSNCAVIPIFCPFDTSTTGILTAMNSETPSNLAKIVRNQSKTFSILV
jgi:uncharacterized Fe-S radical SAM superfamily protein PflX